MNETKTLVTRRRFLGGIGAGCAAGALAPSLAPRLAFAVDGVPTDSLIVLWLRGGLDGLSALVSPEAGYYDKRPSISVPDGQLIGSNGQFGLHPALAPLLGLWQDKRIAAIPASGSPSNLRSHFEQIALIEKGAPTSPTITSGWLTRHLASKAGTASALRAVAISTGVPASLNGYGPAPALRDLRPSALNAFGANAAASTAFRALYDGGTAAGIPATGGSALDLLTYLQAKDPASIPTANGATYPNSWLAAQMAMIAKLLRSGAPLEAAYVDNNGWDTHVGMGGWADGAMRYKLTDLASTLSAFLTDIDDIATRPTVVVMSEFGRRVEENGSGGTDHGRGGLTLVLGKGVRGGVYGTWPGLASSSLDQGDVAMATDYRHVLAEVLAKRLGNTNVATVFPGFIPSFLGFAA